MEGADTLVFNGDGKTLTWHFVQEVPHIGDRGQGEYVFLFGHGKCRYDVAETFRIIDTEHQNESHSFQIVDLANDTQIPLRRNNLSGIVIETLRKVE